VEIKSTSDGCRRWRDGKADGGKYCGDLSDAEFGLRVASGDVGVHLRVDIRVEPE
jgi:hypothetical protein